MRPSSCSREQRKIAPKYWGDYLVQVEDFKTEGFVASSSWPLQVNLLVADGQPIASTIPAGGRHRLGRHDHDGLECPASELRLPLARAFASIPKVQGDVAYWFGSNPLCPQAATASELLGAEGCKANGYDLFDKIAFWKTPIARLRQWAERLRDL